MEISPLRGEVWIVDLNPTQGHEQAKRRPCLIVSNDIFNKNASHLVVVIPLSSRYKKISWIVELGKIGTDDRAIEAYALCNHIRTVSLNRFSKRPIGRVTDNIMREVETRLRFLLDL